MVALMFGNLLPLADNYDCILVPELLADISLMQKWADVRKVRRSWYTRFAWGMRVETKRSKSLPDRTTSAKIWDETRGITVIGNAKRLLTLQYVRLPLLSKLLWHSFGFEGGLALEQAQSKTSKICGRAASTRRIRSIPKSSVARRGCFSL